MDTHTTAGTTVADLPTIGPFYTTREAAGMLHVCQRMVGSQEQRPENVR
jgi:hypothetical protein